MTKLLALFLAMLLASAVPARAEDAAPQPEARAMTPEARIMAADKEAAEAPDTPAEPPVVVALKEKAEGGDIDAMKELGKMYANGSADTLVDDEAAVKWYMMAAEEADAEAQLFIGDAYEKGRGEPQSSIEAARWYEMAAEQGNAFAQGELGRLYALGRGVQTDHAKAYMWLSLADQHGYKNYSGMIAKSAANVNRVDKVRLDRVIAAWQPQPGKKVKKSLKADDIDLLK
jgi:TPR repeat protein